MEKGLVILEYNCENDKYVMYDVEIKIKKTKTMSIEMRQLKFRPSELKNTGHVSSVVYEMKDDGDGYTFIDHHLNKTIELNYCTAEALLIALKLVEKEEIKFEYLKRQK